MSWGSLPDAPHAPTKPRWKEVSFGLRKIQHAYLTGNDAADSARLRAILLCALPWPYWERQKHTTRAGRIERAARFRRT
jgi:hypothetical protein